MVSGSKQHMTTLRPMHTAASSIWQWQLMCQAWWGLRFADKGTISALMSHPASLIHFARCWGMHRHSAMLALRKNSTSLLLQFMPGHWSAQAASTLGLGRFPHKGSNEICRCIQDLPMMYSCEVLQCTPSCYCIYILHHEYIIIQWHILCAWILLYMSKPGKASIHSGNLVPSAQLQSE